MNNTTFKKVVGAVGRTGLLLLFMLPVYPLLWILEPFYRIRLCPMPTLRFGELSAQMDYFTRNALDTENCRKQTYLLFGWQPCNEQLFKMFKRLPFLNIFHSKWGTRAIYAWKPILRKTRFWHRIRWDYAEFALFDRVKSPLRFTEEEAARGKAHLAEMGIGPNDWYVCFHARDSEYLQRLKPELADEWSQLAFKNTAIKNYFPAIDHIVEKGGYALRIGAAVSTELPDRWGDKVIDYSTKFRTDFMDIYLLAHARFFICTSSGPLSVGTVFNVPLLVTSHFPYTHTSNLHQDMVLPRLVISAETGDIVPFYEALADGFYANSDGGSGLKELGKYTMIESTTEAILDGCRDMIAMIEGAQPSAATQELQRYYSDHYLAHLPDHHHGGRIAPSWAHKYHDLIVASHSNGANTAMSKALSAPDTANNI